MIPGMGSFWKLDLKDMILRFKQARNFTTQTQIHLVKLSLRHEVTFERALEHLGLA